MLSEVRRAAMTPLWIAQLVTGAKSFERSKDIDAQKPRTARHGDSRRKEKNALFRC